MGGAGDAMDLNTITDVARPRSREELGRPGVGDAWLAGGTWLFSEPQPHLRRLVDITRLGWEPIEVTADGLSLAATCTIEALDGFEPPAAWLAARLIGQCCRAFLSSFKVQSTATVGGNLCCALPAGPMIALCASLHGSCLIWTPGGGERHVPAVDFVTGPQETVLRRGELLRRIDLPREALGRRTAFRQVSLTPLGRSAALLIGTLSGRGGFVLTVTASTRRPVQLAFDAVPEPASLREGIAAAIPPDLYYDDVHGRPDWRRHLTLAFAEEIRAELSDARS